MSSPEKNSEPAGQPEGKRRSRREERRIARRRTNLRYLLLIAGLVAAPLFVPAPRTLFCKKAPAAPAMTGKPTPVESVPYDNARSEEFEGISTLSPRSRD